MLRKRVIGATIATGLLAAGCSAPPNRAAPSETTLPSTTGECVYTGYTERFIGYWTLYMSDTHVASVNIDQERQVLGYGRAASEEIRKQHPDAGLGGPQLLAALTHEQYEAYTKEVGMGSVDIGTYMQIFESDAFQTIWDGKGGSVSIGYVDRSAPQPPLHTIDTAVPPSTSETAYVQLSVLDADQNSLQCA